MKYSVLIIEDDKEISNMLNMYLEMEGYLVYAAYDGIEGLNVLKSTKPTVVLLDLMMPNMDGITCLKDIREISTVPVIITSAKNSDLDKALALGIGADDYIQKPFSIIELVARIKAVIRRTLDYSNQNINKLENEEVIIIGELKIDLGNHFVEHNGKEVNLTNKEFEILKLFIKNPNRVFTKAQIYNIIWSDEYYGDENVINVHIRRLREKIEEDPSNPKVIKTLWGIGYRYEGTK